MSYQQMITVSWGALALILTVAGIALILTRRDR